MDEIKISRECAAVEIPSGVQKTLPAGTAVRIMQTLGGSYTVVSDYGSMYRIEEKDADVLGLQIETPAQAVPAERAAFTEAMVWDQLKTVYDPEIPVNVVDLGLIYSCVISQLDSGERKIDVTMSVTAPGCGMANVLKADVESKLARLPEVKEVHVEVVFEPAWNPGRMSEAAKLQLGFDADYGAPQSGTTGFS